MKKIIFILVLVLSVSAAQAYTQEDIVVVSPSFGWYMQHAEDSVPYLDGTADSSAAWGSATVDIPVLGDINGDGVDDIAVVRGAAGAGGESAWYSSLSTVTPAGVGSISSAGTGTDQGGLGWWNANYGYHLESVNGDAYADAVSVDNYGGQFKWRASHSSASGLGSTVDSVQDFGWASTDIPLMGDFNGDNAVDMALYNSGTTWYVGMSTAAGLSQTTITTGYFGAAGDIPLVGDLNNDNRDDVIVARANANGDLNWFVGYSDATGTVAGDGWADLGWFGDVDGDGTSFFDKAILADIDGDGKDDMGIYRNWYGGYSQWFFDLSGNGYSGLGGIGAVADLTITYGYDGDTPLIGQFDVVPEPTTLALLGLGGLLLRRKR